MTMTYSQIIFNDPKTRSQKPNPFTGRPPKSCPHCIDSEGFREMFVDGCCPICGYGGD